MKVVIAGLGTAATRGHLPALARLHGATRLVGAAEPDAGRRAVIADRFGHVPAFNRTEAMLAQVNAEVLVIATEPHTHAGLIKMGIEQGLHVVCEKPLTITRSEHEVIAAACARRPDLALTPVHQYRYSPPWAWLRRLARGAALARQPFALVVDLQREGIDRHAATPWRADPMSGGMLADAGVHFIALARTIDEQLEVLTVARQDNEAGGERSAALLRVGSGIFKLQVSNGAEARHTSVELQLKGITVSWHDGLATLRLGSRTVRRRRVEALSDRSHIDEIYTALYRDLAANLDSEAWRMRRTAEAICVNKLLVTLLERTQLDPVVAV